MSDILLAGLATGMDTDSAVKQLVDNQRRLKKEGMPVKTGPKDTPNKDIGDALSVDKVSISNRLSTSGVYQDQESENAIMDGNTAQEAADIVKNFILTNPGIAMSAQANQLPDNILSLLS